MVEAGTSLLLVDDDRTFRGLLSSELDRRGFKLLTAANRAQARELMASTEVELAVVDLKLPDGDGLDVLRELRERWPRAEVVMLTGHGTIDSAIEAMRRGAFDYLRKPCAAAEIEVVLQKAIDRRRLIERNTILRDGFAAPDLGSEFVGQSAEYRELRRMIARVAPTESTVLILGETGVGKDVVARLIHAGSPRARQPLVVVECAVLQESLLQSELFGHERGAFTGATERRHGLFEVADGGTIFLDEIGEISLATQVQLLRVLETGCFRRVGGTSEVSVDVRILAATNRDLVNMRQKGYFREDLFYRLNTIRIDIPPLRRRIDDIRELADHYLDRMNERFSQAKRFAPDSMRLLDRYRWPGNVRELMHVIERALVLAEGETIEPRHLPPEIRGPAAADADGQPGFPPLHEVERRHVMRVLESCGGNRKQAAKILGISERTLYRKLRSYGLPPPARD